jgi:hypothetical protein
VWRPLLTLDPFLPIGSRLDQTGIDRKGFAAAQTLSDAALQDRLKDASQEIALAEAAMPVLREAGVIGHIAVEPEPAEPPVGQIEVDLFAETPLGADTKQYPTMSMRISSSGSIDGRPSAFCGQDLSLPDRGCRFDINNNAVVDIDQIVGRIGEECLSPWAPVHRAAGSAGETNLGTTSVAAPKASSSSTAIYSLTARPVRTVGSGVWVVFRRF